MVSQLGIHQLMPQIETRVSRPGGEMVDTRDLKSLC